MVNPQALSCHARDPDLQPMCVPALRPEMSLCMYAWVCIYMRFVSATLHQVMSAWYIGKGGATSHNTLDLNHLLILRTTFENPYQPSFSLITQAMIEQIKFQVTSLFIIKVIWHWLNTYVPTASQQLGFARHCQPCNAINQVKLWLG